MKVAPTLGGGLKVEAEVPGDWDVLRCIVLDARGGDEDLADRLVRRMEEPELEDDWGEFVVPDLQEQFDAQISEIEQVIEGAAEEAGEGAGAIFIGRDDIFLWFSALNQARLGLEERYGFGPVTDPDLEAMNPARRSGFLRGRFYTAVQGIMLDHLM